jgi:hypothetical protein
MADFGDFLAGFTADLARQRTTQMDQERESKEWERRQRILNDLDVDKSQRLAALQKKDGNTYQDEQGNWMTETLDGNGNVTGSRKATPSERAEAEGAVLGVDMKRDELEYRPTERRMQEEEHQSNIDYKRRSLDIQERGLGLRAAAAGATNASPSIETTIDDWLVSDIGKRAVTAYAATIARAAESGAVRGSSLDVFEEGFDPKNEEQLYMAQERLKQEVINQLRAIPADQRPNTESELKAFVSRVASQARASLDSSY